MKASEKGRITYYRQAQSRRRSLRKTWLIVVLRNATMEVMVVSRCAGEEKCSDGLIAVMSQGDMDQ